MSVTESEMEVDFAALLTRALMDVRDCDVIEHLQ